MHLKKFKKAVASVLSVAMVASLAVPFSSEKKAKADEYNWTRYVTMTDGSKFGIYDNGSVRADLTSQDLVSNEMGLGINLGNTFEATILPGEKEGKSGYDYESSWGQPQTTRAYINKLHEFGINTLRIPVGWSNGDIDDGNYKIRTELFDRVEEVVNYALDNGMYVIINDHWDNQWWGGFGSAKYDENGDKVPDEEMRAEAWKRYESYWTQISERFKDYSDHLIFEGANEELGDRLNDSIVKEGIYKGYCRPANASAEENPVCGGCMTTDELYETVNKINQKFVDIVRSTGGNNEKRFLMIPGYNTDFSATADLPDESVEDEEVSSERFVMPTDPKEENGIKKLLLSVHFYTPGGFCLGSGSYTVGDQKKNADWFALLDKFRDQGYGIVLGECGVCEPGSVSGSVTQWYHDIFELAVDYHACPVIWDTGANFDRTKADINYKDMADLFNGVNETNVAYTTDNLTGGQGGSGSGTASYLPDYIDSELWDKNENGIKMHGYCFYQTTTWDYRDAYIPLRSLKADQYTWNYIKANGNEVTAETTKVQDVHLAENDGSYEVYIDGIDLTAANKFNMLGISTDIAVAKYPDVTIDNVSVYLDGELYNESPYDLSECVKTDSKYYTFMLINEWAGELTDIWALPMGKKNNKEKVDLPKSSIRITFDIHGISDALDDIADGTYVDPEAIPEGEEEEEVDEDAQLVTGIVSGSSITVRFKRDDTSNVPEGAIVPNEEVAHIPAPSESTVPTSSAVPTGSAVPTADSVNVKNFTNGKFKYKVTKQATSGNGVVCVSGLTKKGLKAKSLAVPVTVKKNGKKYTVKTIGKKAFKNAKAKKITLNKNINKIPALAFNKCKKLSVLTLKAKLKSVKKNAFKGCKKKIKVKGKAVKANKKKLKKTSYKKFK
ncbi:MAG: glycoside hydrolase family 5 protein [Lachnospiraceae bacterium]|nr:glycoside hydrolase family 5 protein [Lachnospiraceae bacterium]